MVSQNSSSLTILLSRFLGPRRTETLRRLLVIHPDLLEDSGRDVSRAVMAQALNIVLFQDLLLRVPAAKAYAEDRLAADETILHDHGAVRTIALSGMGALPGGEEALMRILRPLGYAGNDVYPLDTLKMTGRSYVQVDYPEDLPQFFVSELHPERFPPAFQAAIRRVTASSKDPIDECTRRSLTMLENGRNLTLTQATAALPILTSCFSRQHDIPALADYDILYAHSPEAAWIATEGNAFNHAADRVTNVDAVAERERSLGRPMKESVEISRSGRVKQTAYRAATVQRPFVLKGDRIVERPVPGSFYEFISRLPVPNVGPGKMRLDLGFDSANAQGIFKMTAEANP